MIPAGDELARAAWAQAWQVTTLIAVVAVATRLLARNRPHLAHALWLVVLIKCVTPPVWSSSSGVFSWLQAGSSDRSAESVSTASPSMAEDQDAVATLSTVGQAAPVGGNVPVKSSSPDRAVVVSPTKTDSRCDSAGRQANGKAASRSRREWTIVTIVVGWCLGALGVLGVVAVRWVVCLRRIRRCGCRSDRCYDRLITTLARRLKLRRPARLLVTDNPVGPAVIGLFRYTVLLPESIVRGKSPEDLEPILAHELIHVRRGDMWVGTLQMLVQAAWWFHPMVWWAGRLVSREAERCCDEAVVAELGCTPARYARCLFDVLRRKQTLKPLPASAGVRPVEVTSRRMERIMRLGQGSRKRSPWWCWVVMVLAAAATLPGAALVAGADKDEKSGKRPDAKPRDAQPLKPTADENSADIGPRPLPPNPYGYGSAADHRTALDPTSRQFAPLTTRVYNVDDILATLRSRQGLTEEQAEERLLRTLAFAGSGPGSPVPRQRLAWSDKKLAIRETAGGHERFAAVLKSGRKHGFDQIQISVYFITTTAKVADSFDVNWNLIPTEGTASATVQEALDARFDHIKRPWPNGDKPSHQGRAQVTVEKDLPMAFSFLDKKRAKAVLEWFQADRDSNVLQAPHVTVFNGQTACVSDCSQSPFVVGIKDGKPQIRIVSEGTVVRLRALLEKEDSLQLDYELTMSKLHGVETMSIAPSPDQKPTTLQIPQVETARVEGAVKLSPGNTLLMGGLKKKDRSGKTQSMLVMFHATVVESKPIAAAHSDVHVRVYNVADLITPCPDMIVYSPDRVETSDAPAEAGVDFDSLVELITSTVSPSAWDEVGGPGSVAPFETNLSLVVSQTEEVHEEIVWLLAHMRRLQRPQIAVDAQLVQMSREVVGRIEIDFPEKKNYTTLGPREARMFRALADASDVAGVRPLANVMLRNGQLADIRVSPEAEDPSASDRLLLRPVATPDRRSVRLDVAINPKEGHKSPEVRKVVAVDDGQTLLLDVTGQLHATGQSSETPLLEKVPHTSRPLRKTRGDGPTKRTFLLVTPRIVVVEEEEERLAVSPR